MTDPATPSNSPPPADALAWIDCGRFAHVDLEQLPPHWITLPNAHQPTPASVADADNAGNAGDAAAAAAITVAILPPSDSASGNPALAATAKSPPPPPAPRLRELDLDRFLHRLENRLNDPITARPSVRLTDRLSAGLSSHHTQLDDTPEPRRPWPIITVRQPDDLQRLLNVHDAAWTAYEKAGNALGLRFDLPTDLPDCFFWLPTVERFFQRHGTLPILIDGLGPTTIKGWDQLIKAGADLQVYGLARGIPGLPPDRQTTPVEHLTPIELRRADAILHFYVGELGAERVLFGSGLGGHTAVDEMRICAQAQWFGQERPWLEPASAHFILLKNARRLAKQPQI